jgi:hypothetical protein
MNKEKARAFSGFGAIRQLPVAVKDRGYPAMVVYMPGLIVPQKCGMACADGARNDSR